MDISEATPGATREFSAAEIGALAHLYRGEIYRSTAWRNRLDNTTNWAVAGLGLAMSISFSRPDASVLPILLIVAARGFLRQADMLVAGVSSLFFNAGDGDTAARLNEITTRLTDEIELVERLIAKDG